MLNKVLIAGTKSQNLSSKSVYFFSGPIVKKQKMELTIRTPQHTFYQNFDGFSRILTKSNEAALIIQNKSPAALYVLPPGALKVKMTTDAPSGTSGDLLHLGGWAIIHADNTCEINLLDAFEKKQIQVDQFDAVPVPKTQETQAGKYAEKLRKGCARIWTKKAI